MKIVTKLGLLGFSLLSLGTLSACQSTQSTKQTSDSDKEQRHGHLTAEQKQQHKAQRAEQKQLRKQAKQACEGKAIGENVQIQVGDKNIAGQCQMMFKPEHRARSEHREGQHMSRADRQEFKQMTEEQRAQAKQQFDQKRVQRKAEWQALQKACDGQTAGKTIQAKMGDQLVNGQCLVKFQPNEAAMATLREAMPVRH